MSNFVEELVAEYFKTKGYFVMTNYWFPIISQRNRTQRGKAQTFTAQSWSDIDVIAMNNSELLLIQVKAIINEKKVAENVVEYFNRVDSFLKTKQSSEELLQIKWWLNGRKLKKILVYENYSAPKYLQIISNSNIVVIEFIEYYKELLNHIKNRKGAKEENSTMRFIHFLKNNSLI